MTDKPATVIKKIEDGLIDELKRWLASEFYISEFPSDPSKFDPAMMKAAALVHYAGSNYATTTDMNHAQQRRDMRFTIVLYLSKHLAGSGGYETLEDIRKAIQNVPIAGSTPFKMVSDQLSDQSEDLWEWQIQVACIVPAVAAQLQVPRPRIPLNRAKHEEDRR